jgi:Arc/MetJ-type ribon-helix-helix transcriptional regulator
MKQKLSISMDNETITVLKRHVQDGRFRNISHAVEYSVNMCLKRVQNGKG